MKYPKELRGNSKIGKLKFTRAEIELAIEYLAKTYPSLWKSAGQNRKVKLISEVLEAKRKRGYGMWEIMEHMEEELK